MGNTSWKKRLSKIFLTGVKVAPSYTCWRCMFNTFFRETAIINTIILLPGGKQMNMLGANLSMVVESYHIILYILEPRLLIHSECIWAKPEGELENANLTCLPWFYFLKKDNLLIIRKQIKSLPSETFEGKKRKKKNKKQFLFLLCAALKEGYLL